MNARAPLSFFAEFLRRIVAAGSAALVLLLAVLAASPELHERFHAAGGTGTHDQCAVTLFANGVSLACTTTAVPLPPISWIEHAAAEPAEIFVVTPRFLRLPERGPPAI